MDQKRLRRIAERASEEFPEDQIERWKAAVEGKRPSQLVPASRVFRRITHLGDDGRRPTVREQERVINGDDLLDVNYLARGILAARSVGRIVLRSRDHSERGSATGTMVSPTLLLTNHHVFDEQVKPEDALVEFNFELDVDGNPLSTTRFKLDPGRFFSSSPELDMALVAVDPEPVSGTARLADFRYLRMNPETAKINDGEACTIIQHPNRQPKQIAVRENKLIRITDLQLIYVTDTGRGSSGAPVFNDSWQMVALHHTGIGKRGPDGRLLLKNGHPATDEDDDDAIHWIANAGIRVSRIVKFIEDTHGAHPAVAEFLKAATTPIAPVQQAHLSPAATTLPSLGTERNPALRSVLAASSELVPGGRVFTVPVQVRVTLDGIDAAVATEDTAKAIAPAAEAPERDVEPWHDEDYAPRPGIREGYNDRFLGIRVPLPKVLDKSRVAKMDDGEHVIPYEHFSIVMEKHRRLPLFTASNVDYRPAVRRPEARPKKDYERDGLGGLGKNDREKWFIDPRIPALHQLSDKFFSKDRKAFDKGHVVRRDDICHGESYLQIRRANGDTYHITNCTPQVANFNQVSKSGVWGQLEDVVKAQAETEQYCLFAGPVLRERDRIFHGVDDDGATKVKIPSKYWKIVVAKSTEGLQTFGFILEQDLSAVAWEFDVDASWHDSMIAIPELEDLLKIVEFPRELKDSDQIETARGRSLRESRRLERYMAKS